ncbi:MAG TPA: DUF6498-containing protein [Azoarcus taiwanensis]|uniref:Uncharacterized protein n=1 Tax=Azoarcus taiwanensis TaxID=666964 RepID=A0A972F7G9_9RHOO|nr:DUF6498-containing protein [Azoarcus taiwanensis]NMG03072.1 hypothetical protein [Azoarcus taiwanensis]HRQ57397.1 DUF6498-containing protein [Azoarcus taiwanensis]
MKPSPQANQFSSFDSARNLVLANAATLAVALALDWDLRWLMWPYWVQSVIIGWYARQRMLALRAFSTTGFTSNGRSVPETEQGKRSTANFFVLHFGAFHLAYLAVLAERYPVHAPLEILTLVACGLSFAFSQRRTFEAQHAADVRGRPNIGILMFLPYLRIFPMPLGLVFADKLAWGASSLVVFVMIKTAADLALDHADRRMAQKVVVA